MQNASKDFRQFIAAGVFLLLLILLMLYLTFIPVPDANKDLIVTILGVLVGGGATAMPKLFGDRADEETEKLKEKVAALEVKNQLLHKENETLKQQLDDLTGMLVQRHVIDAEGIKH